MRALPAHFTRTSGSGGARILHACSIFVSAKFPLPIPFGGRIIDTEAAAPGMDPADGASLMRGGHSGRAFMWDMSSARSMCAGCIGLRGGRVRAPRACAADRAPCHHPMRERGHTDRPYIGWLPVQGGSQPVASGGPVRQAPRPVVIRCANAATPTVHVYRMASRTRRKSAGCARRPGAAGHAPRRHPMRERSHTDRPCI